MTAAGAARCYGSVPERQRFRGRGIRTERPERSGLSLTEGTDHQGTACHTDTTPESRCDSSHIETLPPCLQTDGGAVAVGLVVVAMVAVVVTEVVRTVVVVVVLVVVVAVQESWP